jgi:hypothetical protein
MGARARIAAVRAVTMITVLLACGCSHWLGPQATLGPGSIVRGRGLYNEVITHTNNEQTLDLIVRTRYGEPAGLLSVASVTANLRASAMIGGQFGIGASANYQGNLVPLSAGVAYEQNPTISYVPVQGERHVMNMLSPIGLDLLGLLLSTERDSHRLISVVIKQVNGLRNSMLDPPPARVAFEESVDRLARLQSAGQAAWTTSANSPGALTLTIQGYAPSNVDVVRELLRMWGLPEALARQGHDIVLPVKLAFGNAPTPQLNIQTRSVYDLIQLAATAVQVPREHVERGLPDAGLDELSPAQGFLTIQNSREQPSSDVLVKVWHRGWWFYIPASDGPSKSSFRFLQSLINMRLVQAGPQSIPALTIPVGR